MALRALRDAWREGDMYRMCNCIEILTTAEHWQAADHRSNRLRGRDAVVLLEPAQDASDLALLEQWDDASDRRLRAGEGRVEIGLGVTVRPREAGWASSWELVGTADQAQLRYREGVEKLGEAGRLRQ